MAPLLRRGNGEIRPSGSGRWRAERLTIVARKKSP